MNRLIDLTYSTINSQKKSYILLFSLPIIILFCISSDSYTHDLFSNGDSAWYFICGKSWMNGMMPYVDFSDSKGPLLWLIYGIGYLISPTNYIGVFWISCIFYFVTYLFTYKIANIFLHDYSKSLFCAMIMTLSYFNPIIHDDLKADEFATAFVTISMYLCCKALYSDKITGKFFCQSLFIVGICTGATLLIKFNIPVMMAIFPFFIIKEGFRLKCNIYKMAAVFIAGITAISLPFVIYFLWNDSFSAFIYEYIIRTFITSSNKVAESGLPHLGFITTEYLNISSIIIFLLPIIGAIILSHKLRQHRLFPIAAVIWYIAIIINNQNDHINIAPLYIFSAIAIAMLFPTLFSGKTYKYVALATVILCIYVNYELKDKYYDLFYQDESMPRKEFYQYESFTAQIKRPKIIYMHFGNKFIGITAEALPGCKFFCPQLGETDDMRNERWTACKEHKTDFILVKADSIRMINALEKLGYLKYQYGNDLTLLSSHKLRLPAKDFHVTNMDVLLKRNIKFKYE